MNKAQVLYLSVVAAVALGMIGCKSKEEFYEDVTLSRQAAYSQWKAQHENKAKSETRIEGKLTIEDCLKLTLINNKTLQQAIEEKEVARGQQLQSYSAILPSAGLSAQYERLDAVQSFDIGGSVVKLGALDNYSAALAVTQPIWAGGSIPAKLNIGTLAILLADQTVRGTVEQVVHDTVRAYYDLLLAQHLVEISREAVRVSQAHLDDVEKRRTAGTASDFDVLRAEVEVSNFNAQLIRDKNAINVSRSNLLRIMGVSQDSSMVLAEEFTFVPDATTVEEAVAAAFRNRPDLMGREFDMRVQKELLRITQSRYWPTINGFYAYEWTRPDPHNPMLIRWDDAWNAGVAATFPLFDGFSREGQVVSQKARVRQSQIDLIDTEERALYEITRSILSVADAAEFVESQKLNLTRAQEGLRLAEVGYREGTQTQVEVMDAQSALTQASVFYYQSIYSHVVAKLNLQRAMGTLTGGNISN